MPGKLRVTQTKSTISHIARNRATVRALGLKRIGHTVEIPDNPATRGMVRQVRFLVSVEEPGATRAAANAGDRRLGGGEESSKLSCTISSRLPGRARRSAASAAESRRARARPPGAAPRARRPARAARSQRGSRAARRRSTSGSRSSAAS